MFGKISAVAIVFALAACVNPKYAPAADPSQNPAGEQKISGCPVMFSGSGKCLSITWEKKPTEDETGTFTFAVYRMKDGVAVREDWAAGELKVVLWMPDMGHGSSPIKLEKIGVGTYRASNAFFSMPGTWEIRFQLKDGRSVKEQAVVPYVF